MDRRRPCDHAAGGRSSGRTCGGCWSRPGPTVSCLPPVAGLPDLVFTANAAMIYRRHGDPLPLSLSAAARRRAALPSDGWPSTAFRSAACGRRRFFEGAGDALFCGDTLFAGYRIRSDVRGHFRRSAQLLGCRVIPLELVQPRYYHLDTCFCPLAPGLAIYYPAAFDDYGRRALEELIDDLIAVERGRGRQFACNAVVLGQTVITNTGCPHCTGGLAERGFRPRRRRWASSSRPAAAQMPDAAAGRRGRRRLEAARRGLRRGRLVKRPPGCCGIVYAGEPPAYGGRTKLFGGCRFAGRGLGCDFGFWWIGRIRLVGI